MSLETKEIPIRVGFFNTALKADQAIRDLRGAGYTEDEIAVICPEGCAGHLDPKVHEAKEAGSGAAGAVVAGGAVGAALGGIGLLVAAATGGLGLLALPVLVGGGAIAGSFSNLILTDGYDKGVGDYYDYAIEHKKIVVGVEIHGADQARRLTKAEQILAMAGAEPMQSDIV